MRIPVILLIGLLTAGAAGAMKVEASRKGGVDFGSYRTYAWKTHPGLEAEHPLAAGSELDRRIREAADEALAQKGMRKAGEEEPDLWVTFTGYAEDFLTVEGTKRQIAPGVSWIGDVDSHWMRSHREGTLVIEVYDAAEGEMVWTGWASDVAESTDKLRKKAVRAARRILQQFPAR